jgi:hypothetical protein|tara:strand:+ start:279 stop:506 length:228 start_codon:yes stop_codon:yes gene_type:complete
MADKYSVMGIVSSAKESRPFPLKSVKRRDIDEDKMKRFCREMLNKVQVEYNEHLRIELWLHRDNGISENIYEIEK